jgi:hypothetical protein
MGLINTVTALNYKTKLAYSFAALLLAVVGTFGMAQNAVPGDMLFSVRKTTEKIQTAFNNNDASRIIKSFNDKVENERIEYETEIKSNIQNTLNTILDKITRETSEK